MKTRIYMKNRDFKNFKLIEKLLVQNDRYKIKCLNLAVFSDELRYR